MQLWTQTWMQISDLTSTGFVETVGKSITFIKHELSSPIYLKNKKTLAILIIICHMPHETAHGKSWVQHLMQRQIDIFTPHSSNYFTPYLNFKTLNSQIFNLFLVDYWFNNLNFPFYAWNSFNFLDFKHQICKFFSNLKGTIWFFLVDRSIHRNLYSTTLFLQDNF